MTMTYLITQGKVESDWDYILSTPRNINTTVSIGVRQSEVLKIKVLGNVLDEGSW